MAKRIKLPSPIKTKADLKRFVEKWDQESLSGKVSGLYNQIKSLYVDIENTNGRAQAARDAVNQADVVRLEMGKLMLAESAPKKASVQAKKNAKGTGKKKAAAAKREPTLCLCGCGEMTRGGIFIQGHDARFKSHAKNGGRLNKLQQFYWDNMGQWDKRPRTLAQLKEMAA